MRAFGSQCPTLLHAPGRSTPADCLSAAAVGRERWAVEAVNNGVRVQGRQQHAFVGSAGRAQPKKRAHTHVRTKTKSARERERSARVRDRERAGEKERDRESARTRQREI